VNHGHGSVPVLGAAGSLPLGSSFGAVLVAFLLATAATALQLGASARLRGRGDRWPAGRSALWAAAAACVPVAVAAGDVLRGHGLVVHVVQHVLLGMVLPVLAALSAPVVLALRTLPPRSRAALLSLLHSRWAAVVLSPPVVVLLEVSGVAAFFLTPLHHALEGRPGPALAVHAHMVVTGYLLASLLVGRDPVRGRPGVRGRLLVLLLVAGAHDTVALLLAASAPAGPDPDHVAAAARLLSAAGTVVDVGLAVLVLGDWYAAGSRRLAHERRRTGQPGAPPKTAVSPRAT
jgi:putative membrane protein